MRCVTAGDRAFWFTLDKHMSEEEFDRKVRDGQGYVLLCDGAHAGILRYNLFWDNTPFCTMLYVDNSLQRRGLGRVLMIHWENEMRARGYGMLMVSTQVDEQAQHFYRKLGYRDCGGFIIDIPGYEQPMEMMMIKGI